MPAERIELPTVIYKITVIPFNYAGFIFLFPLSSTYYSFFFNGKKKGTEERITKDIVNIQLLRESNPFYLREGQEYYRYTKEPSVCVYCRHFFPHYFS